MEDQFTILFSPPDTAMLAQVSRILEARTNRLSRIRFPGIWKQTDRLNNRAKCTEQTMQTRQKRKIMLGILNWFLALFLLLPGLMEPKKMPIVLVVGICGIGFSVGNLWNNQRKLLAGLSLVTGTFLTGGSVADTASLGNFMIPGFLFLVLGMLALCSRKTRKTTFDKAAEKLLHELQGIPAVPIVFSQNGIEIPGKPKVSYQEIEAVFTTEDLIALIYEQQILLLQQKNLQGDRQAFQTFLLSHVDLLQA